MGEAAQVPTIKPEELNRPPSLELVASLGELSVEGTRQKSEPKIDFGLETRERNIFGVDQMPTNPDARLRAIAGAINEHTNGSIAGETDENGRPLKSAVEIRDSVDKYFNGKISFKGFKPFPRSQIVSFGMIKTEMDVEFRKTDIPSKSNLPIYQALRQLIVLNNKRKTHNVGRMQKLNVLTEDELRQTADDLFKVTFADEIIQRAEASINLVRSQTPDPRK